MVQDKWKIIDNKNLADILLEVYGKNEEVLFSNILLAFLNIITDKNQIKEEKEILMKLAADSIPELIENFVNELIYLKDSKLLLFRGGKFKVSYTEKGLSLFAALKGQRLRRNIAIKTDIKALTRHKFGVEKKGRGYYKVTMVFDI